MIGRVLLVWLAASGLFVAGWAIGVSVHRQTCDPALHELARAVYERECEIARLKGIRS